MRLAVRDRLGPPTQMSGDPARRAACTFFKVSITGGTGVQARAWFENGVRVMFEGTAPGKVQPVRLTAVNARAVAGPGRGPGRESPGAPGAPARGPRKPWCPAPRRSP